MIVEKVWLLNWLRYNGDHEIALSNTVYGLTARYVGDDRRSNWAGKTSLIEAIRFALYGLHRANREDGWISRGFDFGQVRLKLTGGYVIERNRRRGQATKLILNFPNGDVATGEEAQNQIERLVGLSSDDFDVTCWFGQKQLSRLIVAKPVERFDLVSGWFNLEGLQRCEESARARLADLNRNAADIASKEERVKNDIARLSAKWMQSPPGIYPTLTDLAATLKAEQDRLLKIDFDTPVKTAKIAVDAIADARRARIDASRFNSIVIEGRTLTSQIAEAEKLAQGAATAAGTYVEAKASATLAADALKSARVLARGAFSGQCPVAGFQCPATAQINARTQINAARYEEAQEAYDLACANEAQARMEHEEKRDAEMKHSRLVARQNDLREQAKALKPAYDAVRAGKVLSEDELNEIVDALQAAEQARAEGKTALREVREAIFEVEQIQSEIDSYKFESESVKKELQLARAAVRIFGRQGAQQRIAETALAEIEAGANAMLRDAGIDLTISVKWAREGTGLASSCSECAAPFPTSAKVRKCACGAERGPKMIEKLDIELSDRSGAAEDLAGAALQLAAAAWLRRERDVQWSTALIDEPFGALDEANRKSFASHLTAMLRGRHGFEQAFIVAHHPDVVDGLPGRITVVADDNGSALEGT